jgi:hypothetical protein
MHESIYGYTVLDLVQHGICKCICHDKLCVAFQILDLGVIIHPGSYLRDIWNCMDSLVVSCAMISFYFQ